MAHWDNQYEIIWLTNKEVKLISEHYMEDKDLINHVAFGVNWDGEVFIQLSDGVIQVDTKKEKFI